MEVGNRVNDGLCERREEVGKVERGLLEENMKLEKK